MRKLRFIDVFAGAGGMSEGFINAGFKPIAHVEIDRAACNTLKTRASYHYLKSKKNEEIYYSYLRGEISRSKLYESVPDRLLNTVINEGISELNNPSIFEKIDRLNKDQEVDLIIGGPPCQAYSLVGRARDANNMKNDPRNYLYVQYAEYLNKYKPKMFVFENVIGLKSAKDGKYLKDMEALYKKYGYTMTLNTVSAKQFGVLQNRRRVIIIGWKENLNITPPNLELVDNERKDTYVKSIFEDLPKLQAGEGIGKYFEYATKTNRYLEFSNIRNGVDFVTQHIARPHCERDKQIYQLAVEKWNDKGVRLKYPDVPNELKTHSNTSSFIDRFKVVADNLKYSQTVVAHISKDGHYYIHPDKDQQRSITVREAARLQSFPDNFYFEGVKEGMIRTAAFKQIGNAVPPLMAKTIGKEIHKILKTI